MKNKFDFVRGEVIAIDKASGISSFDIIRQIKRKLPIKKIGHAGTLDPLASGLVILCTGKKTKEIYKYQNDFKIYKGSLRLGACTASYDNETAVEKTFSTEHISKDDVLNNVEHFLGEISQKPPMYSALKHKGQPLYKLARKGKKIEIKSRRVNIYSFVIEEVDIPNVNFVVKCSKGTYIRSLAHDFGEKLGNGAYLTSLRRTQIGSIKVSESYSIENFVELVNNSQSIF